MFWLVEKKLTNVWGINQTIVREKWHTNTVMKSPKKHHAFLNVDPKLVRSITSALEKIISNKKLRNKLSKKSLENSKKFNWSITTKLLLSNLYKKEFIKK